MSASVLLGAAPAAGVGLLGAEMRRLIAAATVDEATRKAASERIDLVLPGAGDAEAGQGPSSLADLYRDIRARRVIGLAPVAAALAAPPPPDGEARAVADGLGGWLVLAMLERPLSAGLESLVVDACDALRLLKRVDAALLPGMDLRSATTMAGALGLLSEAEAAAQRSRPPARKLLLRLVPVRALLDAAVRARAPISRDAGERAVGLRPAPGGWGPDDPEALIEPDRPARAPGPLDEPEDTASADAPRPVWHVARGTRGYDDRHRDRARTRMAAAAAATRDLALPASTDLMTDHEARTLLAAARADRDDDALVALALSLISAYR